jgi:hypothetical protein
MGSGLKIASAWIALFLFLVIAGRIGDQAGRMRLAVIQPGMSKESVEVILGGPPDGGISVFPDASIVCGCGSWKEEGDMIASWPLSDGQIAVRLGAAGRVADKHFISRRAIRDEQR